MQRTPTCKNCCKSYGFKGSYYTFYIRLFCDTLQTVSHVDNELCELSKRASAVIDLKKHPDIQSVNGPQAEITWIPI